jgi:hypothetical protein
MSDSERRRPIGYPTNRLMTVIDDPAEAAAALAELDLWRGPEPDVSDLLPR